MVANNAERLSLGLKYRKLMPSILGNYHQKVQKRTVKPKEEIIQTESESDQ
jgi:hypothetical protein